MIHFVAFVDRHKSKHQKIYHGVNMSQQPSAFVKMRVIGLNVQLRAFQ